METTAAGVVQKPILKNSIVLLAHKVSSLSENGINALWRSPIVPSSKPLPLLPNDSVQKYLDSDYYLTIYLATQDFNIKNL